MMRASRALRVAWASTALILVLPSLSIPAHAQPIDAPAPAEFVERFAPPVLSPRWRISHGWHSGEWFSSEWRRSQFALGPEGAAFSLAPRIGQGEKPYVSAEIATAEAYLYGYFETRLRMPRGNGLVAAFFTFDRPGQIETRQEIDMELTGCDPRRIELVYHVGADAHLQVVRLPFDASAGFHSYGFDWRADRIDWYVDNRRVHTSRGGRVGELRQPQRIFASLWNSERMPRWLGVIDPAEAPWTMTVNCIAYAPRYEGVSLCS
jgi:endo-1,3-1,4-beta-glycanase ExoK